MAYPLSVTLPLMFQNFKHKKKTLLGRIAIVQMFCTYEIKIKVKFFYNNEVITIPPNPSLFLNYSSHRNLNPCSKLILVLQVLSWC